MSTSGIYAFFMELITLLFSKIRLVNDSSAGPPFYALNFMPKSSVGPPGL
jgi:hypothetical protein